MPSTTPLRGRRRALRALLSLALLVAALAAVASPASAAGTYVGLGDSYASGPLIPSQLSNPFGCLRSSANTAHLVAAQMAATELRDVSCAGAKVDKLYAVDETDSGNNPPQLDAVDASANVVLFQFGGNDIGFSNIIDACSNYNPFDDPCVEELTAGGVDQVSVAIAAAAPSIGAGIRAITAKAPAARVFVLGYPAIVPDSGRGCWPQVPFLPADVTWFRAKHKELNAMLAAQAAANGATYVDLYTPSIGHDACRNSTNRWVEPLLPGNTAAPYHPNATGMGAFAATTVTALRAAGL